jgi:hypothetical protein
VKRRELIRHLATQGCVLIREGGNHSWWETRPEISVPLFHATRKSTSFWLAKSVGTWELPNHETRAQDEQEQAHHREGVHQYHIPGFGRDARNNPRDAGATSFFSTSSLFSGFPIRTSPVILCR